MPAAAPSRGDGPDVGGPTGPQADLEPAVALLLQHAGHVGLPGRADHVDQVVGIHQPGPGGRQVGLGQVGPQQAGLRDQRQPLQGQAGQPERRERQVLEQELRQPGVIERVPPDLGTHPERLRRDR